MSLFNYLNTLRSLCPKESLASWTKGMGRQLYRFRHWLCSWHSAPLPSFVRIEVETTIYKGPNCGPGVIWIHLQNFKLLNICLCLKPLFLHIFGLFLQP